MFQSVLHRLFYVVVKMYNTQIVECTGQSDNRLQNKSLNHRLYLFCNIGMQIFIFIYINSLGTNSTNDSIILTQ